MTGGAGRALLRAFAIAAVLPLLPLLLFTARLVALGEIGWPDQGFPTHPARIHLRSYDIDEAYQLRETLRRRPQVLVLGSSRVLSTRDFFFPGCERPGCFYNAGLGMRTLREGLEFIRALTAVSPPRILVLGVDQWQLNPNYRPELAHDVRQLPPGPLSASGLVSVKNLVPRLRDDPAFRALVLGRVAESQGAEGVEARMHDDGHRPAGSFSWSSDHAADARHDRELMLGTIQQGLSWFPPFEHADGRSVAELSELLDLARQHGIRVVGYMPPFPDEAWRQIQELPGLRDGFADAERRVRETFAAHGFPVLIAHTLREMGCADDEMWDGLHITEVCDVRIYRRLLQDPGAGETFRPYTTDAWLAELSANARSPLHLRADD